MDKGSKQSKATARSVQSAIFIGSLRKELDKLESQRSRMVEAANAYLNEGCSSDEVKELLIIDGYNASSVTSYVKELEEGDKGTKRQASKASSGIPKWGFSLEDSYGRIITSSDLKVDIEASTEEEAWARTEKFLSDTDNDPSQLIDVYPI